MNIEKIKNYRMHFYCEMLKWENKSDWRYAESKRMYENYTTMLMHEILKRKPLKKVSSQRTNKLKSQMIE